MSPGKPTNAGISNDSKVRIKINNMTEKNAGSINRKDIRRMVCQTRAPHAAEASSRDGSIERNAAASMRKTNGDHSSDSIKIMPNME